MSFDPAGEFLRLSTLYAQMGEIELASLASSYDGLTQPAQQALRAEMLKRNLDDPAAPPPPVRAFAPSADAPPDDPDAEAAEECDFTWKTPLMECEGRDQAWQIRELLRRAGIESWVEGPHSRANWDLSYPRILVAADQLDQARQIAAGPIPQEIVELSLTQVPEYEPPTCPACGAEDPILDENSQAQANHWICENCGQEWDDMAGESDPLLPQQPETGEKLL